MNTEYRNDFDALVVGGSFAGLAAATYIARAKRNVLVVDAGKPRNRFSPAAHGFLGQDGRAPADILADANRQLLAYPTAQRLAGEVSALAATDSGFTATLADGSVVGAHKLVLANGISDILPALPGLQQRWGRSVLHCPYCHAYEMGQGPFGVLAARPMSAHQAMLIREWGPVTLFLNGSQPPDRETATLLANRGVAVEPLPIAALQGPAPALAGITLTDGRTLPVNALFVMAEARQHPLASQLGCVFEDGLLGPLISTDEHRMTSVAGVYAAGDIVRSAHSISFAVADGVTAGVSLHRALVAEAA